MAGDEYTIGSTEQLEALYSDAPYGPAVFKETDRLTPQYRKLIEAAPFAVLATCSPDGLTNWTVTSDVPERSSVTVAVTLMACAPEVTSTDVGANAMFVRCGGFVSEICAYAEPTAHARHTVASTAARTTVLDCGIATPSDTRGAQISATTHPIR